MTIAFIYYWETQVDYYLIDYLISLALEIDRETERVFIVKYKCRKLQTKNVGRCNYIL